MPRSISVTCASRNPVGSARPQEGDDLHFVAHLLSIPGNARGLVGWVKTGDQMRTEAVTALRNDEGGDILAAEAAKIGDALG